jgi:hypothetical protein
MDKKCIKRFAAITRSASAKQRNLQKLFYDPQSCYLVATDGMMLYASKNHGITDGAEGYYDIVKNTLVKSSIEGSRHLNAKFVADILNTKKWIRKDAVLFDRSESYLGIEHGNKLAKIDSKKIEIFKDDKWDFYIYPTDGKNDEKIIATSHDGKKAFVVFCVWVDADEEVQPIPEPVPEPKPKPTPVPMPSDGEPLKKTAEAPKPAEPALKVVKYNHLAGVAKMETKWKATANRLLCKKCGHKLANETEWIMAVDTPFLAHQPLGTRDSGTYICPNQECLEFQRTTVFDPYVTADDKMIRVELPYSAIRNVFANWQLDGGIFNVMTACFNAVKYKVLEQFNGDDDDHMRAILWPDLYYSEKDQLKIWADEVEAAQKILADMQQRKAVK